MQSEKEKIAVNTTMSEGINEFVQKHRKPIFISVGVVLLSLFAFIVLLSVMDIVRGKAISAVEEFSSRYETLLPSITEEYSEVDVAELLAEMEVFAQKNSRAITSIATGYAAGKTWALIANIHGEKKNWPAAEAAWALAAKAAKKTYLAPLALFNAGAAAEEQGKAEEAVEYYFSSLAAATDFPGAARAQFAIGRLQESLGNTAAAVEAYRTVISGWSYDQIWSSLAHSRIIALEAEEQNE